MKFHSLPSRQPTPLVGFVVQGKGNRVPTTSRQPVVVLVEDRWNDFGFQTTYDVQLFLGDSISHLGSIKILRDDNQTKTTLPPSFPRLPDNYCSLGAGLDYYEALADLQPELALSVLTGLNDVAMNDKLRERFAPLEGFQVSLLRDPAAEEALQSARSIIFGFKANQQRTFSYVHPLGAELALSFASSDDLPKRLHAVIGYNGCGKTTLLANLAQVASSGERRRSDPEFRARYGYFRTPERFSSTVAVSFSPFDTFAVPLRDETFMTGLNDENKRIDDIDQYSYSYCGIRKLEPHIDQEDYEIELKSPEARRSELTNALNEIRTNKRNAILKTVASILADEPSLGMLKDGSFGLEELVRSRDAFRKLSSGHQIVLSVVVLLTARLRRGSLALIDEPETHLHPPLLGALLKAVLVILEKTESFAIVTTHSPIVLQEIPRSHVSIMRHFDRSVAFHKPSLETFGENIDILTAEAFHLDNSQSTFSGHLATLAQEKSPEDVFALFSGGISNQALSILMQNGLQLPPPRLL